jgi:hypothetical protein
MKIRELREGLNLLGKLLSNWQARAPASDLDRLAGLLERHDDLSVAEFCAVVEKALESRTPPEQQEVVSIETWLEDLRGAENSQELFEPLIAKIKKMRNPELFALANAYCGIEGNFKKKTEAIEAIREKRGADGSARRQLKGITGIF